MKHGGKNVVTVTIEFTGEEAKWLKEYVQNFYGDRHEESEESFRNRKNLFDALNEYV